MDNRTKNNIQDIKDLAKWISSIINSDEFNPETLVRRLEVAVSNLVDTVSVLSDLSSDEVYERLDGYSLQSVGLSEDEFYERHEKDQN